MTRPPQLVSLQNTANCLYAHPIPHFRFSSLSKRYHTSTWPFTSLPPRFSWSFPGIPCRMSGGDTHSDTPPSLTWSWASPFEPLLSSGGSAPNHYTLGRTDFYFHVQFILPFVKNNFNQIRIIGGMDCQLEAIIMGLVWSLRPSEYPSEIYLKDSFPF